MLVDGVDPDELRALMRETARRIGLGFYVRQPTSMRVAPQSISTEAQTRSKTRSPCGDQASFSEAEKSLW
jgi:hypothetical protein